MRELPEDEELRGVFHWFSGFAMGVADPDTERYEHMLDEMADMLCKGESSVRSWEREHAHEVVESLRPHVFAGPSGPALHLSDLIPRLP